MTWKLSLEPKPQVLKLCNSCGKVIDTFPETHPVTKYMINVLHLDETSDLDQLDLGLQPYHWCPPKDGSHCLIPLRHSLKSKEEEETTVKLVEQPTLTTSYSGDGKHAPFYDNKKQGKKQPYRGRPPLTKLLSGTRYIEEATAAETRNESTNSF